MLNMWFDFKFIQLEKRPDNKYKNTQGEMDFY